MSIFGFFKKPSKLIVETEKHIVPNKSEQMQTTGCTKDQFGLLPTDILLLFYSEKILSTGKVAKFWETNYGISNVIERLNLLAEKGFICNGKLTELGNQAVDNGQYVYYIHTHKQYDISLETMNQLVSSHPQHSFRDLIWSEFNRRLLVYSVNNNAGYYRNTKYHMAKFLLEEDRNLEDVLRILAEVIYLDLNHFPIPPKPEKAIAPKVMDDFKSLSFRLNYTEENLISSLTKDAKGFSAKYKNYSVDEFVCIVVAYTFGYYEIMEKIFKKKAKQ